MGSGGATLPGVLRDRLQAAHHGREIVQEALLPEVREVDLCALGLQLERERLAPVDGVGGDLDEGQRLAAEGGDHIDLRVGQGAQQREALTVARPQGLDGRRPASEGGVLLEEERLDDSATRGVPLPGQVPHRQRD